MNKLIMKLGVTGIALLVGCDKGGTPSQTSKAPPTSISMDAPPPSTVEVHDHPSEGPHHGTLVELGKEEFHAEVVHDDKSVSIYILDGKGRISVPIDAREVVINLLHEGKPEQFKLTATPDAGDPNGKSSRFVSNDAELAGHIDDETAAPKLSITINGKSYRGVISHDHAGHDHAH